MISCPATAPQFQATSGLRIIATRLLEQRHIPRTCPHDCPCDAPEQRLQSQREPTRLICEGEESEGFAGNIEDV